MSRSGSLAWLARHELRLAWRDWLWMITAGRRPRFASLLIGLAAFVAFAHLFAYFMVARYAAVGPSPDKTVLVVVTGCALLSGSLILSQALEQVTRVFYARADLDLIMSSPVDARKLFSIRIAAVALSLVLMTALLAAPFIDVLAFRGGPRWLGAYGVVVAMGLGATALALVIAMGLFRAIGAKRTRLAAQILAAIIGAGAVIGLQIVAIFSYGTFFRIGFLQSKTVVDLAPGLGSVFWWPARAMLGDLPALGGVLAASIAVLAAAMAYFAPALSRHAIAAAGVSHAHAARRRGRTRFRFASAGQALRRKEQILLLRDPWLLSQTLLQLLYLLPPVLLLWRNFSAGLGALALLAPVLIMSAGQLAGGLAWLAISGEDAPDLVATAPVLESRLMRAKIEAVASGIAIVFAPFILALAWLSAYDALVSAAGIALAAASATAIQLWFRVQAKRSHFRRRQTSSRIATFAEALSSVIWAVTGALAAAGTWLAALTGIMAASILLGTRLLSPARN
jgi:ABC-2 type transport system permease protein